MQLQDLAREVFVQTAGAVDARGRIRAHRGELVEIEQHRRMALGRQHHVDELTEHVRTDRLALIGARHALDLVGGDAKVIGPEPHQPLDEADLGAERGFDAELRFLQIDRPAGIGDGFGGHLLRRRAHARRRPLRHRGRIGHFGGSFLLRLGGNDRLGLPPRVGVGNRAVGLGAGGQQRCLDRSGGRALQVGQQRAARIGFDGGNRSRARAHAEAVKGQRGFGLCGTAHGIALRIRYVL